MKWSDMPPLSMLRAFEAAARCGGFSAAGRELNVTHAAIAQQVRGLEERLGLTLMRREGRGLDLTPEGRRLATKLGSGMETLRTALADLLEDVSSHPVRLTLTPTFLASWLMPRLSCFRQTCPDVELMLNPSADMVDLKRSEHDLAIRFGVGPWPGLASEHLLASSIVVVIAPELLRRHSITTPIDLLAVPWVQESGKDEWQVWLAAHGVEARGKTDILHLPGPLAIESIRRGDAVGMTARLFVEQDLAEGRLVTLFDDPETASPTAYHLVMRPGTLRPNVATVAAWLRRQAALDRPANVG
ncbi:MAG: LysR substrate-binding domain-containing protein [Pseudomonadota bacterium]